MGGTTFWLKRVGGGRGGATFLGLVRSEGGRMGMASSDRAAGGRIGEMGSGFGLIIRSRGATGGTRGGTGRCSRVAIPFCGTLTTPDGPATALRSFTPTELSSFSSSSSPSVAFPLRCSLPPSLRSIGCSTSSSSLFLLLVPSLDKTTWTMKSFSRSLCFLTKYQTSSSTTTKAFPLLVMHLRRGVEFKSKSRSALLRAPERVAGIVTPYN